MPGPKHQRIDRTHFESRRFATNAVGRRFLAASGADLYYSTGANQRDAAVEPGSHPLPAGIHHAIPADSGRLDGSHFAAHAHE